MPLGWASRMTSTNQKRSKGNPGRFPAKLLGDQPAQAPETAFCKCACDLLFLFCALRLCFVGAAQLLVLLPCSVLRLFGVRGWLISPPQSTAHLLQKWLLGTDGPRPCALEDKGLERREGTESLSVVDILRKTPLPSSSQKYRRKQTNASLWLLSGFQKGLL